MSDPRLVHPDSYGLEGPAELDERVVRLLDCFPYYVMLVDEDHRIIHANGVMRDVFGLSDVEISGQHCPALVHGTDDPYPGCPLEEAAITGRSCERELRNDANDSWVSSGVYPTGWLTPGGRRIFLHTARDITEMKHAQAMAATHADRIQEAFSSTVDIIGRMIEVRDPYTAGHQKRVSNLVGAIAKRMGLTDTQVEAATIAAGMHDLGKVAVPAEILSKPARLSKAEFELVKDHVEAGYAILGSAEFPWPVADIVRQHHERLDGSGYPHGLSGDAILVEARILAVADIVEAMSLDRPYRYALGIEVALAEIELGAGTTLDADTVSACVGLFRDGWQGFAEPGERG